MAVAGLRAWVLVGAIALGGAPGAPSAPSADLLGDAFQGIAFGDSAAQVSRKLEGLCDGLERIDVEQAYLPLATETQTHLIALGVETAGVEEVAFTFGDDALVMVETRGGAIEGLLPGLDEEPFSLGGFQGYFEARVISLAEEDAVWLLSPEALHPHLYLWANPDLPSVDPPAQPYAPSAARPAILDFGAELEALLPKMKAACPSVGREEIAQPWLPSKPARQTQINCYGVVYAGFPRKIEAVFGDGELQLAWILTGKGEEERLRRALVAAHGPPEFVSKTWEAFDGWRVVLRKDKPEVLMLADELVPLYREQLEADGD